LPRVVKLLNTFQKVLYNEYSIYLRKQSCKSCWITLNIFEW